MGQLLILHLFCFFMTYFQRLKKNLWRISQFLKEKFKERRLSIYLAPIFKGAKMQCPHTQYKNTVYILSHDSMDISQYMF